MDNGTKDEDAATRRRNTSENDAPDSGSAPFPPFPDQSGTTGFSSVLSGHAKAKYSHTSSFDAGTPQRELPGATITSGQEEGGRPRQKTTSATGRILRRNP